MWGILLWEAAFLAHSRRGFLALFSSVFGLFLFSVSWDCWAWILAAFSLRISSRVFTLISPVFGASGPGSAGSGSPWILPGAFSAACLVLALGLCSCSSFFFLAWRISEKVFMWPMESSLTVMARFTPFVVLVLTMISAVAEGPSFWLWDWAAFSCLISSRVLMRICSAAFSGPVLVSAAGQQLTMF